MSRRLGAAVLLLVLGCGDPEIQTVRPQLAPPEPIEDFGAVPVLNQKVGEIELLNLGRADLNVVSVTLREAQTPFQVLEVPEKVGAGETLPVKVAFLPPVEAAFEATLLLVTDDPNQPEVELKLVGQGSTRAIMEVEPTVLDFGRVGECGSAVQTLTIRSKGSADLILEEIAFAEGSSPHFGFVGSAKTPAVVKAVGANGLPGQIMLTIKYSVPEGTSAPEAAQLRIRGTDPDQREVLVAITGTPNRAPVPSIAPLGNGALGQDVTLDGTGSSDPDGDLPLSYKWTLRQKPLGAATSLSAVDQATTQMRLDATLPGAYEAELSVTDATGVKSCRPARATVVASPAQKLLIEMFWNHAKTDMDLHLLRTATTQVGTAPDDCYYGNPKPDWGAPGDGSDDPEFLRDALTGYGPEVIGYVNPLDGTYRIVVEHAHAHLDPNPATEVTVRVYHFGVVKAEFKKTLLNQGEYWAVADVEWPTGTVVKLQ